MRRRRRAMRQRADRLSAGIRLRIREPLHQGVGRLENSRDDDPSGVGVLLGMEGRGGGLLVPVEGRAGVLPRVLEERGELLEPSQALPRGFCSSKPASSGTCHTSSTGPSSWEVPGAWRPCRRSRSRPGGSGPFPASWTDPRGQGGMTGHPAHLILVPPLLEPSGGWDSRQRR
jgi:hypothetical protein